MAVVGPMRVPISEGPSPTLSNSSQSTQHERRDQNQRHQKQKQSSERSRVIRSPPRLSLRTAFRDLLGIAEVIVGDDSDPTRPKSKYLIHRELLTAASPFFAAALNSTFAEGMTQEVKLPEEKPDTFEWFLQWLYTGSLTVPYDCGCEPVYSVTAGGRHCPMPETPAAQHGSHSTTHCAEKRVDGELRNHHGSPKYFLLIDLYALSDRLLTTQLSNDILSTIARLSEETNSVPTPNDTWILFDNIRENSTLRMLVLDLFAYKKTDKLLETHKDEWHPRFLRELVVKLKRPGPEAIERHHLEVWRPRSWSTTRACEACKDVLKPGFSADKCVMCEKAFCEGCLKKHGNLSGHGMNLPHDASGCKPWIGEAICARYHEHIDGEFSR